MPHFERFIDNLKCYKEIQLNSQNKLTFFLDKHSTKEGSWGYLTLQEGAIDFVFLDGKAQELSHHTINQEKPTWLIPPASWHKIIPRSDNFKATLQFYCYPHRYFEKKYHLAPVHHDLWYVYQAYLKSRKNLSILDVGCGKGRNPLVFTLSGHQVTGIDSNEASVQIIRDIAKQEQLQKIKTWVHDLNEPLLLSDKQFDFIYSTVVLQFLHRTSIHPLLTQLHDITNTGGMHFLVFPIKEAPFSYPKSFTYLAEKEELYHFYQDRGWSILEYREKPGQLHKLDESGKPIQGLFGLLLAQRNL